MSPWWKRLKPNRSTLPAAALASLLCGIALIAIWSPPQSAVDNIKRFGDSMASTLAQSNAGRMLRQEKIELSVIANQIAADPGIVGVAFYSAGNEILALSGSLDQQPHFTAQATLNETVTGYVTVVVDEAPFLPPARPLAWLLSIAVMLAVPFLSLGALQLTANGNRSLPIVSVPETAPAQPQTSYCLLVNLYNQLALGGSARHQSIDDAITMATETCAVYQGLPVRLGERGVALLFDRDEVSAWQSVGAAFLLMRLLLRYETQGEFRYFLTQAECPDSPAEMAAMSAEDLGRSLDVDQAMTIAALARPATLLIADGVTRTLGESEAPHCSTFAHPLLADRD